MPREQMLTQPQIAEIIEIVRATAAEEILPRYRNLGDSHVETKMHRSDLVTVADKAAEAKLTSRLQSLFPDAFILGEEAVAADASLMQKLPEADLAVIIDPIDGTWNYAHGHPVFGVIISVMRNGEAIFGLHYDPMGDDWIMALQGEGAYACGPGKEHRRLKVSEARPDHEMNGFIPYYVFKYRHGEDAARRLVGEFMDFDRIQSLRCSAHEYRMLAEGSVDFSLTSNLQPWDHVAGLLIHREAGGRNGLLDGRDYHPGIDKGMLLMANDEDTFQRLRARFHYLA